MEKNNEQKSVEDLADTYSIRITSDTGYQREIAKAFIAGAGSEGMVKRDEVVKLIDYIIAAYESDNKFGSNPKPVAAMQNFKNYFNEKFDK